ncbi:MAG: DUF1579 domain-containing protein [Pseudomonadota bacterium]|nr:DUF1579 domain-containing protein [Pseudomonadota bacterium]MDQ3160288.1 DUF1579 domain-containing protein [Pseudomonadota bacterium]
MKSSSVLLSLALAIGAPAFAAQPAKAPPSSAPSVLLAAQKAALAPLSFMDGTWRGQARTTAMDGKEYVITQTERVGPLLDGAIKLIEGRGYNADGSTGFNAFAVLSWNVQKQAFVLSSHAMGHAGDFAFRPSSDGFAWEVQAGPMTMRYTTTIKDNTWHEVGDRVMPDGSTVRFFEMTLKRLGDTNWPASGAVPLQ